MIEPHGGTLVNRIIEGQYAEQIREAVSEGPTITLERSQFQDAINLGTGRFSPLDGFLVQNDFLKVVHDMTLEDGTIWPLPITLDVDAETVDELSPSEKAGLQSPDGELVGAIEIEEIYKHNAKETIEHVFGMTSGSHPGVKNYLEQDSFFVGGPIYLFKDYRYNERDLLPAESRVLFNQRGWERVVGFQTRNVPHRAHEYIQKTALEQTDGLLVQPKLGDKKVDDYRNDVIIGAYDVLFDNYYRADRITLSVFPSQMHYAGPREAVFDALVRKNQGCTHFVVGRDHAGVDDYYDEFESQLIFEEVGDIGIETVFYDHSFYCETCDGMASTKICPHDDDKRVFPSGSKIRGLIRDGERPTEKMIRPEVVEYLMNRDDLFVTENESGDDGR